MDKLFRTVESISDAVKSGLLTPKVDLLLQLILQQRAAEEMHCIIFVERVIIAAVISSLMQKLDFLSLVPSDYSHRAIFSLCEKQQKALSYVSTGKVNVLVATDAVEEDIDVQSCTCVIRFDLPKTVRSFIQSRGHARQSNSNFIILLERGNEKQQKLLYEIIKSEESMKVTSLNINSNHTPCIPEKRTGEKGVYCVSSTGATITCDLSVKTIVNSTTSDSSVKTMVNSRTSENLIVDSSVKPMVNSRTSEDLIVDESDNALGVNVNNISNQNGSPDGGLASEVSTHHGTGKNSILRSQSVSSPGPLDIICLYGLALADPYNLCCVGLDGSCLTVPQCPSDVCMYGLALNFFYMQSIILYFWPVTKDSFWSIAKILKNLSRNGSREENRPRSSVVCLGFGN